MRTSAIVFVCLVLMGVPGCASLPVAPVHEQSSAIGISVEVRAPVKMFGSPTQQNVYFVRLDEGSGSYKHTQLIKKNYSRGNQFYLLNAEPGRYVAVASYDRPGFNKYFPSEVIKLTEVFVTPGTIAFMGDYIMDSSVGLKGADKLQHYYADLLDPYKKYFGMGTGIVLAMFGATMEIPYKCSVYKSDKSEEAEKAFLDNTMEYFKESGWETIIQK